MQLHQQSSPELRSYIKSISPPRELVCPITLELFTDPVIALGDGYTYERKAIITWIQSQTLALSGSGNPSHLRSPVTNAYMETSVSIPNHHGSQPGSSTESFPCTALIENKVIAAMTHAFREKLGIELCRRCQRILTKKSLFSRYFDSSSSLGLDVEDGRSSSSSSSLQKDILTNGHQDVIIGDEQDQIKALIEGGADLSIRGCYKGSTALMMVCFYTLFRKEFFLKKIKYSNFT